MYKRVFLLVMDSVGCGALEDAKNYGDEFTNTIAHISEKYDLSLKTLEQLGYGNVTAIKNVLPIKPNHAYVTKAKEASTGKDTMTGHWEMMGLHITKPFKSFAEHGFPKDLIQEIEKLSNRHVVGNIAHSGTEIIKELGPDHMKTGDLIVYTSADSVLQIAANEAIVPLDELYSICQKVRNLTLEDKWRVGRVIARPFVGNTVETFKRTPNRHDYALKPFDKTVLNYLKEKNYDVISVGKIRDIFDGEGITEANKIKSNHDGMEITNTITEKDFTGLCFINLVDFDASFGHRRDPIGYGRCLDEFDKDLKELISRLKDDDLLIITADHGNDPTHTGTDHTREYVPVIVYNKNLEGGFLPIRDSFADIGKTIAENFNVSSPDLGKSFLKDLK